MMRVPMAAPPVYLVVEQAAYYLENEDEDVLFTAPIDQTGKVWWEYGGDMDLPGVDPFFDVLVSLIRAATVVHRALNLVPIADRSDT